MLPTPATRRAPAPRNGRDAILDAAVQNIGKLGYHGTSVRDIARDAGVTVAAIYHHFGSKQEILQHIMIRVLQDSLTLTQDAVARAGDDPAQQLAGFVTTWVSFHADRQGEALVGASELRSLDAGGRVIIVGLRDAQERIIADVVTDGVESGRFSTPSPTEAVRAILTMGRAVSSWYRSDGPLDPTALGVRYAGLALAMVQSENAAIVTS